MAPILRRVLTQGNGGGGCGIPGLKSETWGTREVVGQISAIAMRFLSHPSSFTFTVPT